MCDGSAVSRITYLELYNVIGTTYGIGNGTTTFNLPNIASRVIAGYDSTDANFNAIGLTGGTGSTTLVANNLPAHTHPNTLTDPGHEHLLVYGGSQGANRSVYGDYLLGGSINFFTPPTPQAANASAVSGPAVGATNTTGITITNANNVTTNSAFSNLQPYIVMRYYIKYSSGNTSIGPTGPIGPTGATGGFSPLGANTGEYIYWNAGGAGSTANAWNVGTTSIRLGRNAGQTGQGANAVAIGEQTGNNSQGANAVAVGYLAGQTGQRANSIVINAQGTALNTGATGTCFVAPIRNPNQSYDNFLNYDATTKEVVYNYFMMPVGTTLGRPSPAVIGMMRYNTTTGFPEFYNGTNWLTFSVGTTATLTVSAGLTSYTTVSYVNSSNSVIAAPVQGGFTIYTFQDTSGTAPGTTITGTITPNFTGSIEYLVIAGGGGGGGATSDQVGASGGGAGGYRSSISGQSSGGGASAESPFAVIVTAYTLTVGAGGAGGPAGVNSGSQGINSVFSTITSTGGGGGGSSGGSPTNPTSGGSGGGANNYNSVLGGTTNTFGTGTTNQGYIGGKTSGGGAGGGGGGGAGAAGGAGGASGTYAVGGVGGVGVSSNATGTAVFRGGGGGGGSYTTSPNPTPLAGGLGGNGGGGNGGQSSQGAGGGGIGQPGTNGYGGGGGGAAGGGSSLASFAGGAGGSGIVILRFPSFF